MPNMELTEIRTDRGDLGGPASAAISSDYANAEQVSVTVEAASAAPNADSEGVPDEAASTAESVSAATGADSEWERGGARLAGAAMCVTLASPAVQFFLMGGPNNADAMQIVCILLASVSGMRVHRTLGGQKTMLLALTVSALLLCAGRTLLFEETPAPFSPPPTCWPSRAGSC